MPGKQLKRIDINSGFFFANGKKFYIEGGMSIERFAEFQLYEKELAYGLTVKGLFERLQTIWKQLNGLKLAEAAVGIYDIITGISKLEEREPAVLKICALVCNEEEEDRTLFSDDMISKKIMDFKAEGIDMRDFFLLASVSVNGLNELYQKVNRILAGRENVAE